MQDKCGHLTKSLVAHWNVGLYLKQGVTKSFENFAFDTCQIRSRKSGCLYLKHGMPKSIGFNVLDICQTRSGKRDFVGHWSNDSPPCLLPSRKTNDENWFRIWPGRNTEWDRRSQNRDGTKYRVTLYLRCIWDGKGHFVLYLTYVKYRHCARQPRLYED